MRQTAPFPESVTSGVGQTAPFPEKVPSGLGRPELARLWTAVHDRLSTGRLVSRVRVAGLSMPERAALADLLGVARLPHADAVVSLDHLDRAVLEATGHDTATLVTELIGPIGDRRSAAADVLAARDELWSWLSSHPVVAAEPALQEWVSGCRRMGLIDGSVDRTRRLLEHALQVMAALPAGGEPLPAFAVATLGDTHALDPGRRVAGVVLHALSCRYGMPRSRSAQARRQLWKQAGIAQDELSVTVLAAGLRPTSSGLVSELCRVCADAGQAASITLATLRSSTEVLRLGAGAAGNPRLDVWVVENPSILSQALSRFGSDRKSTL